MHGAGDGDSDPEGRRLLYLEMTTRLPLCSPVCSLERTKEGWSWTFYFSSLHFHFEI